MVAVSASPRRLAAVLAGIVLAGAALAFVLFPDDGGRERRPGSLELVVQDDAELLHRSTPRTRRTLRTLAQLGADRVRITAGWSALAPAPDAERAPRFDERDSRAYQREPMARLDRAVRLAREAGLDVQIDLAFWAPRWAVGRALSDSTRQRWRPDVARYARFATAIARRYDGGFADPRRPGRALPAVRRWTTWNEPNHAGFLLPQSERVGGRLRPASPHHYRRMHAAAYDVLKAVSPDNEVLLGGLASRGSTGRGERFGLQPLHFLRELACVDERLTAITDSRCDDFAPLRADGFAYHPYTLDRPPDADSPQPDEAGMGELGELSALLDALHRRGRIERPPALHLTEYGYETDPPDPVRGVSPHAQARYHGQATYLAWRHPDVRAFAQFLVRDIGPDRRFPAGSGRRWRDFQTGLLDFRGRAKPLLDALRMPLWAFRDGGDAVIFGRVRPGEGGHRVRVERQAGSGPWETIATRQAAGGDDGPGFETDEDGFFLRRMAPHAAVRVRARWLAPAGTAHTSIALRVP